MISPLEDTTGCAPANTNRKMPFYVEILRSFSTVRMLEAYKLAHSREDFEPGARESARESVRALSGYVIILAKYFAP
jgi:hypothetical protein